MSLSLKTFLALLFERLFEKPGQTIATTTMQFALNNINNWPSYIEDILLR